MRVQDLIGREEELSFLFFYGGRAIPGRITDTCLSQWYPCRFQSGSSIFCSAEQFMMATKALLFSDIETWERIMQSIEPGVAKKLGREVRNFNKEVWDNHKFDIVVRGNYRKFSQNEELKEFLLSTGDRILVEASPFDRVWGIGLGQSDNRKYRPEQWRGENLLGFALMEVRDMLRNEQK